jgi:hypothetical protein
MKPLSSSQITTSVVITFLYILPVVLLLIKVIPFSDRFLVLAITGALIIGLALLNEISLADLGFNHQNLLPAIKDILPVTIISSVLMIAFYLNHGMRIDNTGIPWYFIFPFHRRYRNFYTVPTFLTDLLKFNLIKVLSLSSLLFFIVLLIAFIKTC